MATNKSMGLWIGALSLAAAVVMVVSTTQVAAETEAKPASKRTCVDVERPSSRRVVGPNQMLIEDSYGRSALITLSQPCSHIDELDMLGFEFYGSSYLCDKHDVKILHSRNGERPLKCLITDVKFMDRDQTKQYEADEKAVDAAKKSS